jgi:GDP-4-dehydro-6-deoxy-D-mannose reductase
LRVLVTGADGFVGGHLLEHLSGLGHEPVAAVHLAEHLLGWLESVAFDITNLSETEKALKQVKPDGILHLAAQSNVKYSWAEPAATLLVNTVGSINLVTAVARIAPATKLILIGSSEEYGLAARSGKLLTEEAVCLPQNPYSTSKLAMGQVALQLAGRDNLKVIHVRPFNHFGPGQLEGYVVSDYAAQVARIEKGLIPPVIKVGDLSCSRDFTDVRDVVNAYALLLEKNLESGIYNVCSGIPREIKGILDLLISYAKVKVAVEVDPERFRPSEVPIFVGSADKIKRATSWFAERSFEESILETLEWWRGMV